jgi:hypothetical protein
MSALHQGISTFRVWFAYTLAIGASLFFGMYVIGEGIPDLMNGHGKDLLIFLPWLFLAIIGSILSFFKRKIGSMMMLGAGGALAMVHLIHGMSGIPMAILFGAPYIVAGLFLYIPAASKD